MQDHMNSENHSEPEQQQWIWRRDDHHSNMAARTTTDPATLAAMVEDVLSGKIPDDYSVSEELMGNENLPFDAAAKLARAWDSEVDLYHQVLERDDATPEVLDAWADADNPVAISIIANHPNTKAQTLVKLTKHPHPLAPFWVIITRRLPQDVVDSFASSAEFRVRVAVAQVSNNPETLKKLATDPADEVRLAVATNPHAAATIISELARAEEHPNLQMGRVLGQRLDDPELLGKLAAHSEPRVRLAVAQNPHTSAGTLNELARKEERPCPGMCKALRKRLDQPELLETIISKSVVVKVIPKGTKQITTMQHNYTLTFQAASSGGTKVTISADGTKIAERTSGFGVCSLRFTSWPRSASRMSASSGCRTWMAWSRQ
jgi:hypothetical protein